MAHYAEDLEAVKRHIVVDLASGRLHRFNRRAIERAVETLYENASSKEMKAELLDFHSPEH